MSSYAENLLTFCKTHSEESLYEASLISAAYIREGWGPTKSSRCTSMPSRELAADDGFSWPSAFACSTTRISSCWK